MATSVEPKDTMRVSREGNVSQAPRFEFLVLRWWHFREDVAEVGPNWRKWVTRGGL